MSTRKDITVGLKFNAKDILSRELRRGMDAASPRRLSDEIQPATSRTKFAGVRQRRATLKVTGYPSERLHGEVRDYLAEPGARLFVDTPMASFVCEYYGDWSKYKDRWTFMLVRPSFTIRLVDAMPSNMTTTTSNLTTELDAKLPPE
jgi:hypothetical protein